MAVIEGSTTGTLVDVGVADGQSAMFTTVKPIPWGLLGHYRVTQATGTLAAALAASAQLFTFRWTDATRLCVVTNVKAVFQTQALFTAGTADFGFDLFKATGISAGGGGTAIATPSKMRATMANTLLAATDVRIATTGALTALTVLDTNAIEQSVGRTQRTNPAVGTEEQFVNIPTLNYAPNVQGGEYPLVLSQNEGFVLRNRTIWPAAGTGNLIVTVNWAEVTNY